MRDGRRLVMAVGTALLMVVGVLVGAPPSAAVINTAPSWEVVPLDTVPGATSINTVAINEREVIVGAAYNSAPQIWPMRWDRSGHGTVLAEWTEGLGYLSPTGLNDRGEISGNGAGHAVRWDTSGRFTVLPILGGYDNAQSIGITDDGTVVGTVTTPYGEHDHAVRWTPDGRIVDLGTLPGGNRSTATAVSGSGEVIGSADTASGETHAVRWDRRGRIIDLGLGTARAVNDRGQVVGNISAGSSDWQRRPARWDARGCLTILEFREGDYGTAVAINNRGTAVGGATVGFGSPLRWDRAGHMTVLEVPTMWSGQAVAINDRDEVVGSVSYRFLRDAAYWDRAGTFVDLGYNLSTPTDINERGDIVAGGLWRVVRHGHNTDAPDR